MLLKTNSWLNRLPLFISSLTIYLLASPLSYAAQGFRLSDYFINTWTTQNGLPHNTINAITQTSDGYLWFATWEGVVRFNGHQFKLYNRSPKTGMADSGSKTLYADGYGNLWVGGVRGSITERTGFDWRAQPVAPSLINHIFIDNKNNLWLAIEGMGVLVRRYISPGHYARQQWYLKGIGVRRIMQSKNGILYFATNNGLYRLSENKMEAIKSRFFHQLYYLSESQNGDILLASDNGVWSWNGVTFKNLAASLLGKSIRVIEQDRDGYLWLGTTSNGLARMYPGHKPEFLNSRSGLTKSMINCWYQDRSGSIWIGTNSGIMRLRHSAFNSVTEHQGLVGDYVRTTLALNDKQLLVGSSKGLSLIEGEKVKNAVQKQSIKNLSVLSLAKRRAGGAWVGTYQNGLMKWQNGQLHKVMDRDSGLPINEVRAIWEQQDGTLWLGTPLGLVRRNKQGQIHVFTQHSASMPDNYVMALTQDSKGRLWVGTAVGVAYMQQGQWHRLELSKLNDAQYIFGFYSGPDYLWMATDRGIVRFRLSDSSLACIGRQNGLPIDKFFQIQKAADSLWLSSNMGIWRIGYQQANAVANGTLQHIDYAHFDESNGLASTQANGGSNPASALLGDRLYFATAKGVAFVSPQAVDKFTADSPPVVIESVRFNQELIDFKRLHIVPAGTTRVSFTYAGLAFVMAGSLQYRTKLEGFEKKWSYRHHTGTTEYTNLPPGRYRFLVSSRYPYGPWQQNPAVYSFTIEPLFWQRKSVIFGILFLLILASAGGIYWRIRSLKNNELRLKNLIAMKTEALQEQAQRFERQSKEDALTGLANRRAFDIELNYAFKRAKQRGKTLHLAIIDIDHFKRINDHYTHIKGDLALKGVADILAERSLYPGGIARWGGEEFTVFYEGDQTGADIYYESLRQLVADSSFDDVDSNMKLTVSIGVAGSDDLDDYGSLVMLADHALFAAKTAGRNQVIRFYAKDLLNEQNND